MIFLLFFSLAAHALPSADEVGCLRALGEFEYGKNAKFNNLSIAVKYPGGPHGWEYAWDGSRIWIVNKKNVVKGVPINKPSENAVYLDTSGKTEVWAASRYDLDGDGRANRAFPGIELTEVFHLFLKESFGNFYTRPGTSAQTRARVTAACRNVKSVGITSPTSGAITIAEGVRRMLTPPPAPAATPEKAGQ